MKVEQIYTGCLAQGAYYITSDEEAAIIDPLREVQPYIERAQKDGVQIKYVFETHFHADFVSGHIDLSKKTGAPIVYGPEAKPAFKAHIAKDGEVFKIGRITLTAIHTPGHTMESTCYLLKDESGKEVALFSGDTLFLGDVGRPDLAQKAASMTQEDLAGLLYESIYKKILPLPDDIMVYPAHGAGSACGKNMMKETMDTLGNQKKVNYALRQPNKESFIREVTDGLLPPPAYFPMNVELNKKGYDSFDNILEKSLRAISVSELESFAEARGALILDTRPASEFCKGFIPRSINIGILGDFAPWVGALIKDVKQTIILVTEPGKETESITRLSRVGFDRVMGYLKGGFQAWKEAKKEIDSVERISAEQFSKEVDTKKDLVIDVRKESEYRAEHVEEAYNKPLDSINEWFPELNNEKSFFLHCAGGYRSMIAASILKSRGIHNFKEIEGGFNAIAKTAVPKTNFVCQSKLQKL